MAIGAWMSPAVLAVVLERVVAGDGSAPMIAATLIVAPLVALLASGTAVPPGRRAGVPDVALVVAFTLILAANLVVLGGLARAAGLGPEYGIGAGAVLAVVVLGTPRMDRAWRLALPVGALVLMVPLGAVIASVGAPWTAWATVASRHALTFDGGSAWVTSGHTFAERTSLTFDEPHRVVAATAATWRVLERDGPRAIVREWRLGIGDALTLRPRDELILDAGAGVRFEAGRRIPNSPPSGIAWGDGQAGPTRLDVVAAVAFVVTIVGGALGLIHGRRDPSGSTNVHDRGATVAGTLVLPLVVIGGAASWGIYGVALAPELALVPTGLGGLVDVMTRALPAWAPAFETPAIAGVVALFVGSLLTWRSGPEAALATLCAEGRSGRSSRLVAAITPGLVLLAATAAFYGDDPWRWFVGAMGLVASAAAAPRLAMAGRRGELIGGVVGGAAFVIAVCAPAVIPEGLRALSGEPVLLAAPLAWAVARLTRLRGRTDPGRVSPRARGAVRA